MAVYHRDQPAVRRHLLKQALDVTDRVIRTAFARLLSGRRTGVETIGRCNREQVDSRLPSPMRSTASIASGATARGVDNDHLASDRARGSSSRH